MKQDKPSSDNPYDAYSNASTTDNLRKFSDEMLTKYKNKVLEIYIGDQCETINFEEFSVPQNCIIYCKLLDVLDRFIEVECYYIDSKTRNIAISSPILINAFQIRVMTELDSKGSLNDIFLNATASEKVRKAIQAHIK